MWRAPKRIVKRHRAAALSHNMAGREKRQGTGSFAAANFASPLPEWEMTVLVNAASWSSIKSNR